MRWLQPWLALAIIAPACGGGGSPPADAKKAAAATVEHPQTEADLATVKLSPEAVNRLGIQTVVVKVEHVAATRTLGGEVVVPEGKTVVVSAPVAGTLAPAATAVAGARVARGQTLFRLVPLVPAERDQRIEAERAVSSAEAEEQAARQRFQRLDQLLKDGAASQRSVEEARAQLDVATAALKAARERLQIIMRNPIGRQGEIAITAPLSGVLQTISAAPGQAVGSGAPLFTISQVDTLWVRVPVYAGDAEQIDSSQPAAVMTLETDSAPRVATRVMAPLKADPASASVDLFFEISSAGSPLRPGQRVTVQLPLTSSVEGTAIPDSAVVYDVHATPWVYVEVSKGAFARRRIEVARQVGSRIVVSRGLSAGTPIVSVGAAELFGTEFGAGK